MIQDKLLSFLGIIKKSGKISIGYDVVIRAVNNKQACLILFSSDASDNTVLKIKKISDEHNIDYFTIKKSKDELWYIFNKPCAVLSVDDYGLANKVVKILKEEEDLYEKI